MMTKVMTLALLIGTLALVGCDNNKKTSAAKTNGAVPAPAPEPAPAPAPGASNTPPPSAAVSPAPEPGPGPDTVAAPPTSGKVYVVKKGDTLFKIARANKTHVHDILAANPDIKNPNDIKVGQKINLP